MFVHFIQESALYANYTIVTCHLVVNTWIDGKNVKSYTDSDESTWKWRSVFWAHANNI